MVRLVDEVGTSLLKYLKRLKTADNEQSLVMAVHTIRIRHTTIRFLSTLINQIVSFHAKLNI